MPSPAEDWVTVRIQRSLISRIRRLIKRDTDLGYQTASRFVQDAVRMRLEEFEKGG